MSEKKISQVPSAPPSYEESLNHYTRPPPPSYYNSVNAMQVNQASSVNAMQVNETPSVNAMQVNGASYNYTPYHRFPSQPQIANSNQSYNSGQNYAGGYHVLEFEAGSRFKGKGGGSVSVPPPPPGYSPTPAQLAAMQGQPVIVKKKKNPFF